MGTETASSAVLQILAARLAEASAEQVRSVLRLVPAQALSVIEMLIREELAARRLKETR